MRLQFIFPPYTKSIMKLGNTFPGLGQEENLKQSQNRSPRENFQMRLCR